MAREATAGRGRWSVLAGALALTAPTLSALVAGRHLGASDAVLAVALTPVVVVVGMAAGSNQEEGVTGRLWAPLAGMAGLLLLLPQPTLTPFKQVIALLLLPVSTGMGAVWVGQGWGDHGSRSSWWFAGALMAGVCVLTGVALATHTGGSWPPFSFAAALADGLIGLLTLATLARWGPRCWSAIFLLAPLVTLLEGLVLLRPTVDARSWVGMGLLAIGGGYLLRPETLGETLVANRSRTFFVT